MLPLYTLALPYCFIYIERSKHRIILVCVLWKEEPRVYLHLDHAENTKVLKVWELLLILSKGGFTSQDQTLPPQLSE